MSSQIELEHAKKRLIFLQLAEAPGMIAIGLGLFGKFGNSPESLHPILANQTVANGLLVCGGALVIALLPMIIKTTMEIARLGKEAG